MFYNKKCIMPRLIAFGFCAWVSAAACADVVTSIKPLGFIASAIADGVTPVKVLVPDGVSEHSYSLRPSDIKLVQDAELVVWVGPGMEAFMPKIVAQLPLQKKLEIASLADVRPLLITGEKGHKTESGDHHHSGFNMHLWLSPEIANHAAVAIYAKLLELMPQDKDKLDANLHYFQSKLAQTDKDIEKQLVLVKDKGYFVFHDAYSYFEKHYGLSPLGHFTVNPEIATGAQHLHQIRTEMVQQKAVCVFAEPQFRPAIIDAAARGTTVRKGILDPLGTDVHLGKDSYINFLKQLSGQYMSCLKGI